MNLETIRARTGQEFEFYATRKKNPDDPDCKDEDIIFCLPIPDVQFPYWTDENGNLDLPGDPVESVAYLEKMWNEYIANFKKQYRTRGKSKMGEMDQFPSNIPSITLRPYESSLTFRPCDDNHMVMLDGDIIRDLEYRDSKLFYRGMEISGVDKDGLLYSQDICVARPEHSLPPSDTDLETLRFIYGMILMKYSANIEEIVKRIGDDTKQFLSYNISIYIPDFMKAAGLNYNPNRDNILRVVNKIQGYSRYWGIIKTIRPGWTRPLYDFYPAMLPVGYSETDNTLLLTSPYLNYVVIQVILSSLKRDQQGMPQRSGDGNLLRILSHSYHVQNSIMRARNYRAIEIVHEICNLIDSTDNGTPNITFERLIKEKIPQLQADLDAAPDTRTQNKMLKRAFEAAWTYLQKHTDLQETYEGIKLPEAKNPMNIPTMDTLKTPILIPHKGRMDRNGPG